jgi:hypothetical protein
MITLKKINNEIVKPIPQNVGKCDNRPILGAALFPEIYANIFISARKKSGKTTVIYKILKKCINKHTKVICFVSTLNKDDSYKEIRRLCKANDVSYTAYTSLKGDDGQDLLADLVDTLQTENPEENEEDGEEKEKTKKRENIILCDDDTDEEEEEKPRKSKYRSPEYVFILDDLSDELKSKSVTTLLKKNRHFKSKIIISSQYLNDLPPESRKQMDYFLVFKGLPPKKLEELYRDSDIPVSFENFTQIYENAVKERFNFMYIDRVNQIIRKNFNKEYNIEGLQ